MATPLVLYSTNTWLAFRIAEMYYQCEHYVWCNRYFDSRTLQRQFGSLPPTSSPGDIYHSLNAEVEAGDRHSPKIEANRAGILRGASVKSLAGVITDAQEKDIRDVVNRAETRDFRPLLFIIPYSLVADEIQVVPVAKRAHPLWEEYVIEALLSNKFDVIELMKGQQHGNGRSGTDGYTARCLGTKRDWRYSPRATVPYARDRSKLSSGETRT